MLKNRNLTPEYVREILDCDYATGILKWKWRNDVPRRINVRHAGKVLLGLQKGKYARLEINDVRYPVHHIIWLHYYGTWATRQIDHINLDKKDNRIENLRLSTHSQNQANRRMPKTNTSGEKNVGYDKARSKWMTQLTVDGKFLRKRFDTFEEAAALARQWRQKYFGEFARHD